MLLVVGEIVPHPENQANLTIYHSAIGPHLEKDYIQNFHMKMVCVRSTIGPHSDFLKIYHRSTFQSSSFTMVAVVTSMENLVQLVPGVPGSSGPDGGQISLDGADHSERQDLGRCQVRC